MVSLKDSARQYVMERFDGIEKIYPGKILVDRKEPDYDDEYGLLSCPECRQCGNFVIVVPATISIKFGPSGEIFLNVEDNIYNLPKEGEIFTLYHMEEEGTLEYEQETALFEEYGETFQYNGNGPYCPNCGTFMGYDDGERFNECYITRSEAFMMCMQCMFNYNRVADEKFSATKCLDCANNYARIKYKIKFDEIVNFLKGIPKDE